MNDKEIKESIAKIYSDGFTVGAHTMLTSTRAAVIELAKRRPKAGIVEVLQLLAKMGVPK